MAMGGLGLDPGGRPSKATQATRLRGFDFFFNAGLKTVTIKILRGQNCQGGR